MKLKDILNISENKKNKQQIWNPKKRTIKKAGLSIRELLNMELKKK